MRNRSLFAPLALVGAIFVAVCIGLYFFNKPEPIWGTSSLKVQSGIEFIGVYKGIPKHVPYRGYDQLANIQPYDGDLWAYFRIDRKRRFDITASRIFGKGMATDRNMLVRTFIELNPKSQSVIAVPVLMQYAPGLRNGSLVLYNREKQIGSWQLSGMPAPNPVIGKSEPDHLEGAAAGCTIKFAGPAIQQVWQNKGAAYPSGEDWKIRFDAQIAKKQPEDCFEADLQMDRTTWNLSDDQGWHIEPLNAEHNTLTLEKFNKIFEPADRVAVLVKVRRFRIQKDFVVLKDVVLTKAPAKSYRGYRLVSCQNANVVSDGGLRLAAISSSADFGSSADMVGLTIGCSEPLKSSVIGASKLSRSLNQPIELYFAKRSSTLSVGSDWKFSFEMKVPTSSRASQVRLDKLIIPFVQRAVLEEQTIRLLGPVKTTRR